MYRITFGRGADRLLPAVRTTTYGIETVRFIGNKLWQILPPTLKSIPIIEKLKKGIISWRSNSCAIHAEYWPDINKLEIKTTGRALRNSDEIKFQTSLITKLCKMKQAKYFNQLPTEIRNAKNLTAFCSVLRDHLFARINVQ